MENKNKNFVSINILLNVHGGITFSDFVNDKLLEKAEFIGTEKSLNDKYWVFGFDTVHFGDNKFNWPKEEVIKETLKLKEILENFAYENKTKI